MHSPRVCLIVVGLRHIPYCTRALCHSLSLSCSLRLYSTCARSLHVRIFRFTKWRNQNKKKNKKTYMVKNVGNKPGATDATGTKNERCEHCFGVFRLLNTHRRFYGFWRTRPSSVSCESSMPHKQIKILYVQIATSIVSDATPSSVYMCIDCAATHSRTYYIHACVRVCVCVKHLAMVKIGAHTSGQANALTLSPLSTQQQQQEQAQAHCRQQAATTPLHCLSLLCPAFTGLEQQQQQLPIK